MILDATDAAAMDHVEGRRSIATIELPPIEEAIRHIGSEKKLGEATGYSQAAINKAKKAGRVSAEMAVAIERATSGKVPRHRLRPDLFERAA